MSLRNDNRPWYKERWPWFLMAGPAIVIVAGLTTAWLAVISNDGLVTDDYYKQGLAVNQSLERDRQAGQLGLTGDLMRADQNVRLLLNTQAGVALPPAITLKLAHPTRAGHDQMVEMAADGPGIYTGKLSADIVGRWLVSIEDPAGKWRLQGEWKVDSGEPLRLTAKAVK
ncbi:MAG: FixH family protein [Bacteroidota bacterium]